MLRQPWLISGLKITAWLLILSCGIGIAPAALPGGVAGAWLGDNLKWQPLAGDNDKPPVETAEAHILYLGAEGRFVLLYCWAIRSPKQHITISHGDPREVYKGKWSMDDDGIDVSYELVEATISRPQSPPKKQRILRPNDYTLVFDGEAYHPTPELERYFASPGGK